MPPVSTSTPVTVSVVVVEHAPEETPTAVAQAVAPSMTGDCIPIAQAQAYTVVEGRRSATFPFGDPEIIELGQTTEVGAGEAGGVPSDLALTDPELTAFSYRGTVRCLALLDVVISIVSVMQDEGVVFLSTIVGPLLGMYGAAKLHKTFVAVYLFFCCMKLLYYLVLLFGTNGTNFIILIYTLIQIWVTRIVSTFFRCLNSISEERLATMRDPTFLPRVLEAHRDFRARYF